MQSTLAKGSRFVYRLSLTTFAAFVFMMMLANIAEASCSLSLSRTSIQQGEPVTLSYSSKGDTPEVYLQYPGGTQGWKTGSASGQFAVESKITNTVGTYTWRLTGNNCSRQVTLSVLSTPPAPVCGSFGGCQVGTYKYGGESGIKTNYSCISGAQIAYCSYIAPPSCDININKSTIATAEVAGLSWTTKGATAASLTYPNGATVANILTTYPNNPAGFNINDTNKLNVGKNRYTMTVANSAATRTCSAEVLVTQEPVPVPVINLTASTPSVTSGQSVTISWTTTGATKVRLIGGQDNLPINGSLSFKPTKDTIYTFEVTNSQGYTARASREITVGPVAIPKCSLSINKDVITRDELASLQWTYSGAVSGTLTYPQGATDNDFVVDYSSPGSFGINVKRTLPVGMHTYFLTVKNANGVSATCSDSIQVLAAADQATCSLNLSKPYTVPGEPVAMEWVFDNAVSGYLTYPLKGKAPGNFVDTYNSPGGFQVTPPLYGENIYKLTVTGTDGVPVTCSDTVFVSSEKYLNEPEITVKASQEYINSGESVVLSWSTVNATEVTIIGVGKQALSGSLTVSPNKTTQYTFRVFNEDGVPAHPEHTITVYVDQVPPAPTVSVNVNKDQICTDEIATLAWNFSGAQSGTLTYPKGASNPSFINIFNQTGGFVINRESQLKLGVNTYTVSITNSNGQTVSDSDSVSVIVCGVVPTPTTPGTPTPTTSAAPNLTTPNVGSLIPSTSFNKATGIYSSAQITYNVQNNGASPTGQFQNRLQFDYLNNGSIDSTSESVVANLAAGENSSNETVTLTNVPFGTHQVQVLADHNNQVEESNENDNLRILSISLPPPSLGFESSAAMGIWARDKIVRSGQTTTINWNTAFSYPMTCTVDGLGVNVTFNPSVSGPTGSAQTDPITAAQDYALVCTEPVTGTVFQESVRVETTGQVEEI